MKVLLIDDHAMFREGLSLLVAQRFPEVQLLHADSLKRALALLAAQPAIGIVLLDLGLPDSRGMDGLVRLRAALPQGRIVVLSADDTPATVRAALEHGAAGFLPKSADGAALQAALRTLFQGGMLATAVPAEAMGAHGLSPRQLDVLRLLVEGAPTKQICRELGLAEPTVKSHLAEIYRRLGIHNRTQAVAAAARLGLRFPPR